MSRLLVHLHLFYTEQTDYFVDKLKNINGIDWDLTITGPDIDSQVLSKFRAVKPDLEYMEVENFGYDIWPFIMVMKSVDLARYDYVMKLHTKRSVRKCAANVIPMRGEEWRNALVDGMLYSEKHFLKILNIFKNEPQTGMISNLLTFSKRNWETYRPSIEKEMRRLGLKCSGNHFCMGTMFMCRSEILLPLKTDKIYGDLFSDTVNDKSHDFKSAHYYERILSILPGTAGMKHKPVSPRLRDLLFIKSVRFFENPVRWIFAIEKKGPEKRKFMRLFGIEFYIEPPKDKVQVWN